MFTPPASPAPPRTLQAAREPSPTTSDSDGEGSQYLLVAHPHPQRSSPPSPLDLTLTKARDEYVLSTAVKRRTGRRTRWTVLLIPLVLVLITASTRYVSHPALLDIFSREHQPADWETLSSTLTDWRPHKRHASPDPAPQDNGSSVIFATPTSAQSSTESSSTSATSTSTTGTQTIPTIPATAPVLPTPFPQPLDSTFSRNFSTQGCLDFFSNMTQSTSFRSCRPFSLLSVQSNAFIQAQDNITLLNELVWGTCNTNTDVDQCNANLGWFVDTLEDTCSNDIKANNAVVLQTRDGLLAYSLLRNVACLPDQTTNAYCYLEAVHASDASDSYLYKLPYGIQLPSSATPSCSACTKSIMNLYAQSNLTALSEVYNGAATIANSVCGSNFVQVTAGAVTSPASPSRTASPWILAILSLAGSLVLWS